MGNLTLVGEVGMYTRLIAVTVGLALAGQALAQVEMPESSSPGPTTSAAPVAKPPQASREEVRRAASRAAHPEVAPTTGVVTPRGAVAPPATSLRTSARSAAHAGGRLPASSAPQVTASKSAKPVALRGPNASKSIVLAKSTAVRPADAGAGGSSGSGVAPAPGPPAPAAGGGKQE